MGEPLSPGGEGEIFMAEEGASPMVTGQKETVADASRYMCLWEQVKELPSENMLGSGRQSSESGDGRGWRCELW